MRKRRINLIHTLPRWWDERVILYQGVNFEFIEYLETLYYCSYRNGDKVIYIINERINVYYEGFRKDFLKIFTIDGSFRKAFESSDPAILESIIDKSQSAVDRAVLNYNRYFGVRKKFIDIIWEFCHIRYPKYYQLYKLYDC